MKPAIPALRPLAEVCICRRVRQFVAVLWRSLWLLLLGMLLSDVSVCACSVPVFRYALEKWPPDAYQATLFHRGSLSEEQQGLARDLGGTGPVGRLHANVSLQTVDLAQSPTSDMLRLWQQLGTATLPWLVVRYPQAARLPDSFISAPLAGLNLKQLVDSPARREISRLLGQGKSAVWVLLESGDRDRDDAVEKRVETRLGYLASVLKLPTIDPQDVASGLVSVPVGGLKLAFSVVRVGRENPAEASFIRMLLGTEPDLAGLKEPILFPVFGRGRALYALAGNGINHETLDEAATFLIGKCSCQVKELNPGVDLLLAADWNSLLKAQSSAGHSVPTVDFPASLAPETVTFSGAGEQVSLGSNGLWATCRHQLFLGTVTVVGLLAMAFWLRRR